MGSSEAVDTGKSAGKGVNFSRTCSLLSQYLKEKGGFGELSLGLSPKSEEKVSPVGTMDFLQMMEKSERSPRNPDEGRRVKPESAPLTIFYAGQVIVFNDFPAEKADEIMKTANRLSGAAARQTPNFSLSSPANMPQSPAESGTGFPKIAQRPPQLPRISDLPIPRKKSLARFLEKRRDRITASDPYQAKIPSKPVVKTEESWLGLATQTQRH